MPLYEYQCDDCGGRFERIRKFSDPPLDEPCPKCGGPIRKLVSSPAFQFKGSGWYVTDYAKSGSPDAKSDSAASGDAKADAKGKDKASDTKSETKTESTGSSTPAAASSSKPEKTAEKK